MTAFIVTGILFLANIFEILQKFQSIFITPTEFWLLISYKVPHLFNEVSIIVGFISTILFIQKIRRNNELIIILGNGIPIWKIFFIPITLTFFLGMLILVTINPLGTYGLKKIDKIKSSITGNNETNLIISQSGIFFYEKYADHNRIMQAKSIDTKKKTLQDLIILITDGNNNLIQRLDAPITELNIGEFKLIDAEITSSDNVKKMQELVVPTNLSIKNLMLRFNPPEKIYLWSLKSSIRQFAKSGLPVTNYQLYYFKKILNPLAMVAMSFIACWFVSLNLRDNTNSTVLTIGLALGACTYFFLEISFRILAYSGLTPFLATSLPIIFIILISNFVILHFQEA
jgi:lipopolysaccharide export system permease protein